MEKVFADEVVTCTLEKLHGTTNWSEELEQMYRTILEENQFTDGQAIYKKISQVIR